MHYVWDFAILGKYSHLFWLGLGWTVAYTIGTVLLGTLLGLLVGILRLRRLPVIDWLLLAYIELFRCTPLLVQIIWFYYAFPVVIGVNTSRPMSPPSPCCRCMAGRSTPRSFAAASRASIADNGTRRGRWACGHGACSGW